MFDFLFTLSKEKPVWVDLVYPTVMIGLAAYGYWRAFKAWEKQKLREIELNIAQKKEEIKIGLEQKRYESEIAAHKAAWSLLAYMSEKENDKTVFVDRGDKDNKIYVLRVEQAKEYLITLPKVFFTEGNGLFMSREIEDDLYTFRSRIYQILEKAFREKNEDKTIEITNETIQKQVKDVRERLRKNLLNGIWKGSIKFEEVATDM
jgi:hypothetical protein